VNGKHSMPAVHEISHTNHRLKENTPR
jgi:hypothetical protein